MHIAGKRECAVEKGSFIQAEDVMGQSEEKIHMCALKGQKVRKRPSLFIYYIKVRNYEHIS